VLTKPTSTGNEPATYCRRSFQLCLLPSKGYALHSCSSTTGAQHRVALHDSGSMVEQVTLPAAQTGMQQASCGEREPACDRLLRVK